MKSDLLSPEVLAGALSRPGTVQGTVDLRTIPLAEFTITPDFKIAEIHLPHKNYDAAIRGFVEPIATEAERKGYSGNAYTALYEALRNAHQHGHHTDSKKPVLLGHRITKRSLDLLVGDSGGIVDAQFLPFLLENRAHKGKAIDYYAFTGKPKPDTNNGTGTSFMHAYMDRVEYFRSPRGGLLVHLHKNGKK